MRNRRLASMLVASCSVMLPLISGCIGKAGVPPSVGTTAGTPYVYFADSGGPTQKNAYIYNNSTTTNPPGGFLAGPASTTEPFWYINQYSNPSPIVSTTGANGAKLCKAGLWSYGNLTSGVCWIPDQTISGNYDAYLSQNGSQPAPNNLACGTEFDLFIGPDNYAAAGPNPLAGGPVLSGMSALTFGFNVDLNYTQINQSCGSATVNPTGDQTSLMAAVVFQDSVSGQTFFYQIILNSSKDDDSQFCSASGPLWYFDPQTSSPDVFGVDDWLASAYSGQACPPSGASTFTPYSLNILPRVTALINSDPSGKLDKNLADWTVSGVYYGSNIFGSALTTSLWTNLSLVASTTASK